MPPPEKASREVVPAPLKPVEPGARLGFKEGMTVRVIIMDDQAPFRAFVPRREATTKVVMAAGCSVTQRGKEPRMPEGPRRYDWEIK